MNVCRLYAVALVALMFCSCDDAQHRGNIISLDDALARVNKTAQTAQPIGRFQIIATQSGQVVKMDTVTGSGWILRPDMADLTTEQVAAFQELSTRRARMSPEELTKLNEFSSRSGIGVRWERIRGDKFGVYNAATGKIEWADNDPLGIRDINGNIKSGK